MHICFQSLQVHIFVICVCCPQAIAACLQHTSVGAAYVATVSQPLPALPDIPDEAAEEAADASPPKEGARN